MYLAISSIKICIDTNINTTFLSVCIFVGGEKPFHNSEEIKKIKKIK